MKKIVVALCMLMVSGLTAVYFPPVGNELLSPESAECNQRFGRYGSGRYACGRSIDICQNWFGLTGQKFQDCQKAVLLFHGIRESHHPL